MNLLANGDTNIFDLQVTTKTPTRVINSQKPCITLEFNKKQTDLLAVAHEGRSIKIYQLPQDLISIKKNEQDIFVQIIEENNV